MKKNIEAMTDEALIRLIKTVNCQNSFAVIMNRYGLRGLRYALTLLYDKDSAEDALQETFIKVSKNREQFRDGEPFAPWFFKILKNVCLDMLRNRKKTGEMIERLTVHTTIDENCSTEKDTSESNVLELLNKLAPKEKQVLVLRIKHDLSLEEIATTVGCSVDAAKKRAQRGMVHLREMAIKKSMHFVNNEITVSKAI